MYLGLGDIEEIQLDHTSRCNLDCPQCARTRGGWSRQSINKGLDLNLEDYQLLLAPFPEEKLVIFHCGNYGDAIASPTFDQTLRYTLSREPKRVTISTNGSLRPAQWWRELAQLHKKIRVTFAIDGLEDTNHIYRVGSDWNRIMQNAGAFIEAGGRARWDFIEFQHNFHQIEEAEALAKKMGFEKFNVKYTARFASIGRTKEMNSRGGEITDRATNANQKDLGLIAKQYDSFDDYVASTKITCKYQQGKKVFVDMNMRLWPCCWFGAPTYFTTENPQVESFRYLESLYGSEFNDLRKHGWSVLEHEFFRSYLENSWADNKTKSSERFKRIYTCGRTCGEKFEFSSGYGQNTNVKYIQ